MRVGDRGARGHHDLRDGDRARIGSCACSECRVDVLVPATAAHWCLAEVSAESDRWQVSNLSVDTDLWVMDMEDEQQRVRLAPGRLRVDVPFEFSRLHFRHAGRRVSESLVAIGQEQVFDARPRACRQSLRPLLEAMLRPGTTYMAVVEELCRISDRGTPPTSAEIAARLSASGWPVTRRAVDHHIDYVYDRLFPHARATTDGPGWKRLAVASVVTRAALLGVEVFAARTAGRRAVKGEEPPRVPVPLDAPRPESRRVHTTDPDLVRKREIHTP